jgi:hypothetical protein
MKCYALDSGASRTADLAANLKAADPGAESSGNARSIRQTKQELLADASSFRFDYRIPNVMCLCQEFASQ